MALTGLAGCARPEPVRREHLDRGYIMILPGVECYAAHHAGLARGLREAGLKQAIVVKEWGSHPFGTLPNLLSYELNRQRAAVLAEELSRYRSDHPSEPMTIVGFSGGGAMALFIAEALPPECRLNRIILMGAAVAPTYDLGPALARCENGIVNFYSPHDWFMIGLCTSVFGTMDRRKVSAAGRVGFRDAKGDLLERPGLVQISWKPAWRRLGHLGFHAGWRSRAWAREILAPEVMDASAASVRKNGIAVGATFARR